MEGLADRKAALRKLAATARKAAHAVQPGAGRSLLEFLPTVPEAAIVSGFAPIRSEIDTMPLMAELQARGHRLCLPVIQGRGLPLLFREWWPGAAMERGPFGAEIPAGGEWLVPSVLLVPLLAFDRRGFRLGYGGGFYDRTLEALRARDEVLAIGLAYAAQEVDEVPAGPGDQPLDAILTEAGLVRAVLP